jgi:hypothetical protein
VYERLRKPHAVIPCPSMPRLGVNRFLTIEQIQGLAMHAMSPECPINKQGNK